MMFGVSCRLVMLLLFAALPAEVRTVCAASESCMRGAYFLYQHWNMYDSRGYSRSRETLLTYIRYLA